ncbi:MAG: S-layer homology domain-containing protein [Acidobacteriota bacterium]|nr:S-layer homology domain-containing protein [Acidobacteriota bacterium]
MRKQVLLIALLAGSLASCMTGPGALPSIHIEPPTPGAAASLTLDERIAVQDAWTALREGRLDRSRKLFARLPPDNPFVAAGLGYLAIIDENLAAAEDYLQRSIEIQPELTVSYLGLGQVYQKTGQDEPAYKMYLEALKREPENEFARKAADDLAGSLTEAAMAEAARAAGAGQPEKSKAAYLQALEYSPRLKAAHNALARLFIQEKDFHSAFLHMKAAGDDRVEDTVLLREFADALYKAGQWSRSLEIYEQIIGLDPQDKPVKDRIDQIKNRLGVVDLPDQYAAIARSAVLTREDAAALIGVQFREILSESSAKPPIIVDITVSWAQRYIIRVAALSIMEVYSNHTFLPKKTLNRAEFAEILSRLIETLKKSGSKILPQIAIDRIRITDVPQEHFYFQPVAQAVAYGLMELSSDRAFKPELPMTGREAVRTVELLAGLAR